MSNVLQAQLNRFNICWKVLICFRAKKQGTKIEVAIRNSFRLLERELESDSMGNILSQLPFVNVINVDNRQILPDLSTFDLEKDFHVLLSSCSRSRSLRVPQECNNIGEHHFA